MDSRSVRHVWLLATVASLLTWGPRLTAQSQQKEDTQAPGAVEGTQTEAQTPNAEASTVGVAESAQNPFSSMTIVNFWGIPDVNIGPYGRTKNEVHLVPVFPTRLGANWTLSTWVNIPVAYQPILTRTTSGVAGLADVQPMFIFLPGVSRKVTWGIGPAFNLPTATNVLLSTGKFSLGPAMLVVVQPGAWTIGVVANYLYSVGGPSTRPDVNQLNPAYFINYNLRKGWYLTTNAFLLADWTQPPGSVWKVPFGGGVGRVMKLGSQLVNVSVVPHVNVVHNSQQERWNLFLQLSLLYPKKSR